MKRPLSRFCCLTVVTVAIGCGEVTEGLPAGDVGVSSAALGAVTTTTATSVVTCSSVSAIMFSVDTTAPSSVSPGETFSIGVTFHMIPPVAPPYSGEFAGSATLSLTSTAPGTATLPFETVQFPKGTPLTNFGASSATITAASSVGQPIQIRLSNFDYTISPDDAHTPVDAHCLADPTRDLLVTIPVVQEPNSQGDCKGGGYKCHTDDQGRVFKNQGQCIKYVQ